MTNEQDIEYLSRPLLQGTVFLIEDSIVKITSPNTIFAEARSITPITKRELMSLYSKVLWNSKKHGAKISYKNHIRREINRCWTEYENSCAEANNLFYQIVEQANIIQSRGIHFGTSDDGELSNLHEITDEYQSFFYRGGVISKISDIYGILSAIDKELSAEARKSIQIYL